MAIKVVTDSTSYIPYHLREEYDISVVSLGVTIDAETFREEDMDNEDFYVRMAQAKSLPTSSQPAPREFYQVFENKLRENHDVVGIFLSSEMSGTYSTALMVKNMLLEKYPAAKIEIVDGRSNSMELGFAVLAAAKAAKAGQPMEEVIAQAKYVMERSRFLFVPDTLHYLQKGGRIGGAAALLGSLLQIRPILTVIDGKTALLSKVRKKERALQEIVKIFLTDIEQKGLEDAVIHHINFPREAQALAEQLAQRTGRVIPVYSIGPVIGLHVGPGTLGIAYYTKEKRD
ncbi:DegV family protein [Desulforamulus ferrireducens]|uniref:Fatty acid-binding protein DegV n=1 Tax=Desulforamulus ferrireducens TaxID=1833852 RepID=A0A1S6ITP9_9FIRM|nr:DegV family protein [Desulforamulus ferrireducens]AQS58147.1 fatty acid-binding protein DegV [Desulforamulus ferrireducens]